MKELLHRRRHAPAGAPRRRAAALVTMGETPKPPARPVLRALLWAFAIGAAVAAACTSSSSSPQLGAHVVFTCYADGTPCEHPSQCCGAACVTGLCVPRRPDCVEDNFPCSSASDCCTNDCDPDGVCTLPACIADFSPCTHPDQCCSHTCSSALCVPPPDGGACVEDYDPCIAGTPCCSGACDADGFCGPKGAGPRCKDDLITCASNADCCSSYCDPRTAICGFPPNPTACRTKGSACTSDSDCCSTVCDPTHGICDAFPCVADGGACKAAPGAPCCDGLYCTQGACGPCVRIGKACQQNVDCCTLSCSHGVCTR